MGKGVWGEYQKGKGNGKGKNTYKGNKAGKTLAPKGKGKGDAKGPQQPQNQKCKCCGKTNHLTRDCRHKEKECTVCGKFGHLKVVCRHAEPAQKDDPLPADAATLNSKQDVAAPDEGWTCEECCQFNVNSKMKKCEYAIMRKY